jgi:hypothetical protein
LTSRDLFTPNYPKTMPCDWTKYPSNWKTEIRPRILKRDGNCCKKCGLQNHSIVIAKTRCPVVEGCTYAWAKQNLGFYHDIEDGKAMIIVLTIAHLDHNTTNNADENLAALCQKCHLTHDAKLHANNARATRDLRSGQMPLILG